jgi:hypothetical protein
MKTAPLVFDDSEGWLEVSFSAGATMRLDLYEAFNVFLSLQDQHPVAVNLGAAWVDWLASKGTPALSHAAAFKVADAVIDRVNELRKLDAERRATGSREKGAALAEQSAGVAATGGS